MGIEVEYDRPTGVGEDKAAEPADIAFLHNAIFDFAGDDGLELVDADARVVLVQGVDPAAARRQTVIGNQEGRLIDTVDIGLLGDQIGELGTGNAGQRQRCRQDVRKVEQPIGPAGADHAFPVDKGRHPDAALPARSFATAERGSSIRWNLALRTVVGGEEDYRVF